MRLEEQVISLELSKKLKELGVPQDGFYIWWKPKEREREFELSPKKQQIYWKNTDNEFIEWCSAYTVAELGEMLPDHLLDDNEDWPYTLRLEKGDNEWLVYYSEIDRGLIGETIHHLGSLADAMAHMLIYLLENNLIEV